MSKTSFQTYQGQICHELEKNRMAVLSHNMYSLVLNISVKFHLIVPYNKRQEFRGMRCLACLPFFIK